MSSGPESERPDPFTHAIYHVQGALNAFETLDRETAVEVCCGHLRTLLNDLRTVYGALDPMLETWSAATEAGVGTELVPRVCK